VILPEHLPTDFETWPADCQRAFVRGFNQGMERTQIAICDAMMLSAGRPEVAALPAPLAIRTLAKAYDHGLPRLVLRDGTEG